MRTKDILTEKRLSQLEEMVSELSPQELSSKHLAEEIFLLVDVSDPARFAEGHIAGAVNIPLQSLVSSAETQFKKFQQIVLYHNESSSGIATLAARKLQATGFSNVVILRGGKEKWQTAGFELDGVQPAEEAE